MGRFFIFIYIFLEVGELYDGTNITKLSHHDGKFTEEINQLINQLINLSKSSVVTSIFILNILYRRSKYDQYEVMLLIFFDIDYIDYTCNRDGKDYEYETYVIIIEQNV